MNELVFLSWNRNSSFKYFQTVRVEKQIRSFVFLGEVTTRQFCFEIYWPKGQLISKYPYEKSVSSKIQTKIFLDFCPEIFCSFLGASWKLFGLPGDLVFNIINKEAYRKPPGRFKKFQGRNPEIILLVFLSKQ